MFQPLKNNVDGFYLVFKIVQIHVYSFYTLNIISEQRRQRSNQIVDLYLKTDLYIDTRKL